MELVVANVVVATVAISVVAALVYRFYRQVPPRRAFVRNRQSDVAIWEGLVGPAQLSRVESVLAATCEAFLLKRSDAWRLRPGDTLRAMYESSYPPKLGLPDALEYEFLFRALHTEFGVPEASIRDLWAENPTLADMVALCLEKPGQEPPS
jgi:hypothetical protein